MTTIAWDGKTLATDSRATHNSVIEGDNVKKLFKMKSSLNEYLACAVCGDYVEALKIIKWIKLGMSGDFPEIDKDRTASVVCLREDKTLDIYRSNDKGFPLPHKGLFTDGSGWELALGAMDCGATAVKAVKIAIGRDTNSGGKVQSYTLEGKL